MNSLRVIVSNIVIKKSETLRKDLTFYKLFFEIGTKPGLGRVLELAEGFAVCLGRDRSKVNQADYAKGHSSGVLTQLYS